jgi:hypothetical protein
MSAKGATRRDLGGQEHSVESFCATPDRVALLDLRVELLDRLLQTWHLVCTAYPHRKMPSSQRSEFVENEKKTEC